MFGLSKTRKSLFDLDMVSEDHRVFNGWIKEIEGENAHAIKYKKIIQKYDKVDMNLNLLKEIQSFDIEDGGFGVGNVIEQKLTLECDKNEYSNVLFSKEYEEKYETIFKNVSTEKDNMEDTIFHCLSKFPEHNRTNDMIRNLEKYFRLHIFLVEKMKKLERREL
uniref:Uncharacterized protein n=1 Tax=Lactuca sativa TaxID=4236 RepID=A0A9R1XB87_LACSA|nr:hypothetical protein LSAT_V11C600324540 [Lactuca sativa]